MPPPLDPDYDVKRLSLKLGDEIVLTAHTRLTQAEVAAIKTMAEQRWPDHKVTVLNQMTLTVLTA